MRLPFLRLFLNFLQEDRGGTKDKECKNAIKMHPKKSKNEEAQKHTQEKKGAMKCTQKD
jgi:hypothetical protein